MGSAKKLFSEVTSNPTKIIGQIGGIARGDEGALMNLGKTAIDTVKNVISKEAPSVLVDELISRGVVANLQPAPDESEIDEELDENRSDVDSEV